MRSRMMMALAILVFAWAAVEALEWALQVAADLAYRRGGGR